MTSCTYKAYAKINLGLDVVGVLPNGYHEVRMVMQNVGIHDTLHFVTAEDEKITLDCDSADIPLDENNLIYQAVLLMQKLSGRRDGVHIRLEKRIPVAAGMAGGSSDAAATLKGINELWGLGIEKEILLKESVRIGADVPYCLLGQTALAEGIGEKLTPIGMPPKAPLVIAKPDIGVSTPHVYRMLDAKKDYAHPDIDGMVQAVKEQDLEGIISRLGNVLELVTVKEHPVVGQIRELLLENGAKGALMSGSGPSCFGIFGSEKEAEEAYERIRETGLAAQLFLTEFA